MVALVARPRPPARCLGSAAAGAAPRRFHLSRSLSPSSPFFFLPPSLILPRLPKSFFFFFFSGAAGRRRGCLGGTSMGAEGAGAARARPAQRGGRRKGDGRGETRGVFVRPQPPEPPPHPHSATPTRFWHSDPLGGWRHPPAPAGDAELAPRGFEDVKPTFGQIVAKTRGEKNQKNPPKKKSCLNVSRGELGGPRWRAEGQRGGCPSAHLQLSHTHRRGRGPGRAGTAAFHRPGTAPRPPGTAPGPAGIPHPPAGSSCPFFGDVLGTAAIPSLSPQGFRVPSVHAACPLCGPVAVPSPGSHKFQGILPVPPSPCMLPVPPGTPELSLPPLGTPRGFPPHQGPRSFPPPNLSRTPGWGSVNLGFCFFF